MDDSVCDIKYLCSEAYCQIDDGIWFSAMGYNGLFYYKFGRKRIEFITSFPHEKHTESRLHGKAIKVDKEIYFLPDRSRYIHIYNTALKKIESINLKEDKRIGCRNGFFYNNAVYFITGIPDIVVYCINIKTKKIRKHRLNIDNGGLGISQDIVLKNGDAYFTCKAKSQVIKYSCEANTYQIYHINSKEEGYGTICYDGKDFWLSSRKGIIRCNSDFICIDFYNHFPKEYGMTIKYLEEVKFIKGFTNQFNDSEFPFSFSVFWANKVWLFPFRVNMIIQIDIVTGKLDEFYLENEYEDEESLFDKFRSTHCHYFGGIEENRLMFMSTKSKKIRIVDEWNNLKELYLKCEISEDIFYYLRYLVDLDICYDNEKFTALKKFFKLNIGTLNRKRNDMINFDEEKKGYSIYTVIKETWYRRRAK